MPPSRSLRKPGREPRRARRGKPRRAASAPGPGAAPPAEGGARERILSAALRVFAERGFEGARTREIARCAGANLGLIKYYFDTKEGLWQAAVARAFGELGAELGPVVAPPPGDTADERARLERLVRGFVLFVARRPEFMRLMNDEGKRDGPRMRWLAEHHVRPMVEAVRPLLEAATAHGLLPPIPSVSLHYITIGAAGLVFSQAPECRYVTGADPATAEFARAHADALLRLLFGAPREAARPGPPGPGA